MTEKIRAALEGLAVPGSRICVAFSGGCDSSALLCSLAVLRDELGFELSAVHVNHGIRGDEAERDARFAAAVCAEYSVPLVSERVDVPAECARTNESAELCARRLRYAVFERIAADGWLIATAHTASDSAETVLFNLARGSGLKGMCGIPPRRGAYIRPLLSCTREDTERFCAENNIEYVTDSTNLSDEYTRNFVRHNVVPMLRRVNPSLEDAVASMTQQLRDVDEMLDRMAQSLLESSDTGNGYDCLTLLAAEYPVLSRAVRVAAQRASGLLPDSGKTERICAVVAAGGRTQLGGGWYAAGGRRLRFYRECAVQTGEQPLNDGVIDFGGYLLTVNTKKAQAVNNLLMHSAIDCDKIIGKAVVRSRREGDGIKLPRRPRKALRRLMNEMGVPAGQRDSLPVVADDGGVIFVPDAGCDERVAPDKGSRNVIIITAEGKSNA